METKYSNFRKGLTKIKVAMILSTFHTVDWANKRRDENFVSVALIVALESSSERQMLFCVYEFTQQA